MPNHMLWAPGPGFSSEVAPVVRHSCAKVAPRLHRACPSLAPGPRLPNHPEPLSRIIQNPPDSIWSTQNPYLESSRIFQNTLPESSRMDLNHPESFSRILHCHWNATKYVAVLFRKRIVPFSVLLQKPIVPFSVLLQKPIVPFSVLLVFTIVPSTPCAVLL